MYRGSETREDRARALAGVLLIHAAVGIALLSGFDVRSAARQAERLKLFNITYPPPPPPPPPEPASAEGAAGEPAKMAEASPVVAPKPEIPLPVTPPVAVAPLAAEGAAASSGASIAGTGTGAGGTGDGSGGGGSGGGGGIGKEARLLGGGLSRWDYYRLRAFDAPSGQARLAIMVGADGRVASCAVADTSGDSALDSALCAMLQPRMRWVAARDRSGKPITVRVHYVATWERY